MMTSSLINVYGSQLQGLGVRFGHELRQLSSISGWDFNRCLIGDEVQEMQHLIEAIALNCTNLKVLELDVDAAQDTYRDTYVRLLEQLGHNLTELWLRRNGLSNQVIDTIARCCTNLKRLYVISHEDDDPLFVTLKWKWFKSLTRLEIAGITVQQLVHFEFTDQRFKSLVECHMRTMTAADFRLDSGGQNLEPVLIMEFINQRFSKRLTRALFNRYDVSEFDALLECHPQLFPKNIKTSRDRLKSQRHRYTYNKVVSFYDQVYFEPCASNTVSIGRRNKINPGEYDLRCWDNFLSKWEDQEDFQEDFSSVTMVTPSKVDDSAAKHIALLSKYFPCLKEVTLHVYSGLSTPQAEHLRYVIEQSAIKVRLFFVGSDEYLAEESKRILGEYIVVNYTIIDGFDGIFDYVSSSLSSLAMSKVIKRCRPE
ncbi:hypothetical protein HDE_01257 [Halotydeus destructor]|nr:hypothetical protein HDE_01257 [Halotydeus destructor]